MLADQAGPASAPAQVPAHCPGCWSPAAPGTPFCPACGFWLAGPQAAELHGIELELQRVEAARTWLIRRRAILLGELTAGRPGPAAPRDARDPRAPRAPGVRPGAPGDAEPGTAPGAAPQPARRAGAGSASAAGSQTPRPEISGPNAARLLLAAGAALVVIAATIFTIAGWSRLGEPGRAGILTAITALALACAPVLRRRGLGATAETVAGIGLALTLADGYLGLRVAALPRAGGWFAAAAAAGLLAVAWAGYGTISRLTLPRVAAIGAAKLPVLLAAAGLSALGGADGWFPPAGVAGFALILDAAASFGLVRWLERPGRAVAVAVIRCAVVAAVACWLLGVLVALTVLAGFGPAGSGWAGPELTGLTWPARAWIAATMIAAAAAGVAGPRRGGDAAWPAGPGAVSSGALLATGGGEPAGLAGLAGPGAVLSGALLATGCAVPLLAVTPAGWALGAAGGCGWAVSAAAFTAGHWARRYPADPAGPAGSEDPAGPAGPEDPAGSASVPASQSPRPAAPPPGASARTRAAAWPRTPVRAAAPGRGLERSVLVAAGGAAVLAVTAGLAVPVALAGLLPVSAAALRQLPGTRTAALVLALTALTCWFAPESVRQVRATVLRPAGLAAAALAVPAAFAVPAVAAAVAVPGLAMAALTAAAAGLLAASARLREPGQYVTAAAAGTVLAAGAALRSLAAPDLAVTELAVLTVLLAVAAALSRRALGAALYTAAALTAAAGLAWSAAWAAGWPPAWAAFAMLAVTVLAAALSTVLRQRSPLRAGVLDAGAVVIAAASLAGATGDRAAFSLIAVTAALAASAAAWRRDGRAQAVAVAFSCSGVAAALIAQSGPLAGALLAPARVAAHPWRGHVAIGTAHPAGLPFAVIVGASCVVALASAAGAARGRRASLDVAAVALTPVAFLAAAACGLGYWPLAGLLLALTLGLAGWAAAGPDPVPAWAALLTAVLAVSWGLAAPLATVLALAASTAGCVLVGQRARHAAAGAVAAGLAPLAAGALAVAAVLAVGGVAWQAGLAMLDVVAAAFAGPGRDRRQPAWALVAALEIGCCAALAAAGAGSPEPYVVPAALIALAPVLRRLGPAAAGSGVSSWRTWGAGLALGFLPSLIACWLTAGWIRPVALAGCAAAVAVAGGRARLRAPLLAGTAVAVLAAARELAPVTARLAGLLPGWIPVAAVGAALLWAGATYEARLRNLRAVRRSLAAMD